MASIEVPTTTTPAVLGTDLVADEHHQKVRVTGNGMDVVALNGVVTPASIAYLAGESIGGNFRLDGVPQGFYELVEVAVVGLAGQDLSGSSFDVFGYSVADEAADVVVADGDAVDVVYFSGPGSPVVVPSSLLGWSTWAAAPNVRNAYGLLESPRAPTIALVDPGDTPGEYTGTCSLCLGIYADGAIADDLTAGPLIVSIKTQYLGPRISAITGF